MTNLIDYVTIQASTGNSVDFGDLTQERQMHASGSESPTRGIFIGGISPGP